MSASAAARLTFMCTFLAGALVTVAAALATVAFPVLWPAVALVAAATPVASLATAHRAVLAYETV